MPLRELFSAIGSPSRAKRPDIVEKDFHLHTILREMASDDYLSSNLVFKGVTCLIKAYLGYFRFSEDVDFTWGDKTLWSGKSKSRTVAACSREISDMIASLHRICGDLGLVFHGDKRNDREVHISSGGRMVTMSLGYDSEVLRMPNRIKVEVNLVESIHFPVRMRRLNSYAKDVGDSRIPSLFRSEWKEYAAPTMMMCYDPREIFIEKCRASMTRRGYKLRDSLDLYFMEDRLGLSVHRLRSEILRKIDFMLDLYLRYRENIELSRVPRVDLNRSQEMMLLLGEAPSDLRHRVAVINDDLEELRQELVTQRKNR
jgi:predicted nucleotidyltransferase component of viral defense system